MTAFKRKVFALITEKPQIVVYVYLVIVVAATAVVLLAPAEVSL